MPAKSKAQQRLAAIALHSPSKVKESGIKHMEKSELRKLAETPRKGLPEHKKKREGVLA